MRFGLIAAACLAALIACSPKTDETDGNSNTQTQDAAMTGPFADYMPWNSDHESVLKTQSGLEYIIIKSGDADGVSPTPQDQVRVHYEGRLADGGKKFDSSFDRGEPAVFPAGGLIKGWVEALQMMKPGDEWLLYIPSELGYGERGAGGGDIPGGAALIFHMQLLDVVKAQAADEEAWNKYTPWPTESEDVLKTASGLEYVILASGDPASTTADENDFVLVHAEGRLADGESVFISSFMEGAPKRLPAGQPVLGQGWQEAVQMMRAGDHWLVKVPYTLAFGEEGSGPIPAKSDVIFEIDMQQIIDLG